MLKIFFWHNLEPKYYWLSINISITELFWFMCKFIEYCMYKLYCLQYIGGFSIIYSFMCWNVFFWKVFKNYYTLFYQQNFGNCKRSMMASNIYPINIKANTSDWFYKITKKELYQKIKTPLLKTSSNGNNKNG